MDILSQFALGLDIPDGYGHLNFEAGDVNLETKYIIEYKEAKKAIQALKEKFGGSTLTGLDQQNIVALPAMISVLHTF